MKNISISEFDAKMLYKALAPYYGATLAPEFSRNEQELLSFALGSLRIQLAADSGVFDLI